MACRPSSPTCDMPGGASARSRVLVRGRAWTSSDIYPMKKSNTIAAIDAEKLFLRPRLARDPRSSGHRGGDERVAADHGTTPDDGLTAHDGRVGVDDHVILERGVPAVPRLG